MPAAMPAHIAERLSDVRQIHVTDQELDAARDEMIEKLLEGKQVGHVTFADILDCELDSKVRSTVGELAQHMLAITGFTRDEHQHVEHRRALERFMRAMVERWVDSPPERIHERAVELAADEGE